jgi:hypothetical protein
MPRGRNPEGEHALSNAERQARYRAAHAPGTKPARRKPAADRRGRPQRWRDAVAQLILIQADCQAWLDGLPDGLQHGATAEALQAICELDLAELEGVVPPRGFGRD